MKRRSVILVTGLSGSGKSTAIRALEDAGFFCVDNLPLALLEKLLQLSNRPGDALGRVALGMDSRDARFVREGPETLARLRKEGWRIEIIFFEAAAERLVARFSETQRRHPSGSARTLPELILQEAEKLAPLKEMADRVVDTTEFSIHDLRTLILDDYVSETEEGLKVQVLSFGYRSGIPLESDIVLDARFLPNPHYVDRLRPQTGLDEPVYRFVMKTPEAREFKRRLEEFLVYLIEAHRRGDKSRLTIAFGCTGGRHRSVAFARWCGGMLKRKGYRVTVHHRDIGKD